MLTIWLIRGWSAAGILETLRRDNIGGENALGEVPGFAAATDTAVCGTGGKRQGENPFPSLQGKKKKETVSQT